VEHGGAATGKSFHGSESVCTGRSNRLRVARLQTVGAAERDNRSGHVETEHSGELTAAYSGQYGMADRSVQSRVVEV
jgi:hypothetical protein